ncbi:MAG: glycoside-pentoside-hexuronide (GPH):cation symporter, partial [Candidatus Izemoplasmatales bacterium]|nr:glycoside-pentoside-hexuronide (GPH):cation symporter [Candidatus Izemoplasmatales bacterium]
NVTQTMTFEQKLLRRNKWMYSVGGIGRDMIYQLVATFLMTYVQYSGLNLGIEHFSAIGTLLVIGRVWDAINDPIMGSIVENTHTRWGKYRPWILLGGILTSITVFFMFTTRRFGGWDFVIFFGVIYLLWEIAFTLNDIPYWSLIPNLSRNKKDRDEVTSMVVVFAGVGAFLANAIISFTTVGNAVQGYARIAVGFVIFFMACTLLTSLGVREPKEVNPEKQEKITIKKMFSVIRKNDQLLWASLSLMLYSVGSGLLVALGYNFFYIELGYNGTLVLISIATFGVCNILIQSFYASFAKRFSRKKLLGYSFVTLTVGYVLMLIMGYVPFIPVHIVTVCLFGALIFSGQAIFYMVIIVNMTNTIEYNEYKTGNRNEAVIFSLRPFVAKFSSALQQGIFTLVLIISGVYALSQNVSALERQKNIFETYAVSSAEHYDQTEYMADVLTRTNILDDYGYDANMEEAVYDALQIVDFVYNEERGIFLMEINAAADSAFKAKATGTMKFLLRLSITILPIAMIYGAFYVLNKKYFITEAFYEKMNLEIQEKQARLAEEKE